ncbi:MAG: flagellar biosynthetic protein FliO [Desulfovibrio sp.]|jgi:flagellar biosynthetic protein FliO|nr:flagellar biosynthetic protein FliO [Desulfovibrio sp.]
MNGKKCLGVAAGACRLICAMSFLLVNTTASATRQNDPALPPVSLPPAPYAAGGSTSSPSLPGLSGFSLSWSGYFEALAVVCFSLALLWALLWLIKRHKGNAFSGTLPAMRVESRLALGPKKWIIVVRCLDRRLVLGLTDERISLLTEIFFESGQAEKTQAPSDPPARAKVGATQDSGEDGASLDRIFASLLRTGKESENSGT